MRSKWWGMGLAGLAAALVVGGCSADSSDSPGTSAAAPESAVQDKGVPGGAGAPDDKAGTPIEFRVDQRAIIYTGSIAVRVADVDKAATAATSLATGAGGFVGGDKRSSDGDHAEATLILRVPADRFTGVVDGLARLGEQERRDITTEDVTEEALDLDARIATQRARVDSGRRLLAQAKSLADLVMLEGELAKREADLASLEAKERRLADLTALSTITVQLLKQGVETPEEPDEAGFLAGLKGGWNALVTAVDALLTMVGALLPFLVALGVPVLFALWLTRRLRRPRPTAPTAAAPSAPPAP